MATQEKAKLRRVLREFKAGTLHHGSKRGPKVTDRKVALAIALNSGRKAARGRR